MEALRDGTPLPPLSRKRRNQSGPVVIWHPCRDDHAPVTPGSELDTQDALALLEDLHAARVRSLILAGPEPMMRPDFFGIIAHARELGIRVLLSTDGSRLSAMNAVKLAAYRLDYVGIQIDGLQPTHNHVHHSRHAYQRALRGLRAARNADLRVGMRMALSAINAVELPAVLALAESECIDRFHLSQACLADCAHGNDRQSPPRDMTLAALEWLFDHVWMRAQKGDAGDFVTSQHAANGVYLRHWMARRAPHRLPDLRERVVRPAEARTAGVLHIDPAGGVHPGTARLDITFGNVRERAFTDIATEHPARA